MLAVNQDRVLAAAAGRGVGANGMPGMNFEGRRAVADSCRQCVEEGKCNFF
jgi:hypothetical protein